MSNVNLFNGVTFVVDGTNTEIHTFDEWGLYVTNTDCIKEPKQYTRYIEVPGRNGLIDLSDANAGRQTYTSREIKIRLAGTRFRTDWDGVISSFRNKINGKICKVIFDNDPLYYWRGRVTIKDFVSVLSLGTFTIEIPNAEPYKYSITTSADPWLWDPFNFETGIITYMDAIVITSSGTVTIPHGTMPTNPEIVVSEKTSTNFTVTAGGVMYSLTTGSNIIPSIFVGGDSDVTLEFAGSATIQIVYRNGSL